MDKEHLEGLINDFLEAWNSQDVERVLACYTVDVLYRDPNTRGYVQGRDALRSYLGKLFDSWQMTWATREYFQFADGEGVSFLWHATFRRPGGAAVVAADGMDLVVLKGDLLARNEVYFDRTALMKQER